MMGKRKPQKTKELSVAIAEASSTGDDETKEQAPQAQPPTPRKRGRPRKVIQKTDKEEPATEGVDEVIGNESKRGKTSEEEQVKGKNKEEGQSGQKELPRRSSRRKSKPRKSSS